MKQTQTMILWMTVAFLLSLSCAIIADVSVTMESLEFLYNTTNGARWHWFNNTEVQAIFGKQWDFTKTADGAYIDDPCRNWQGICCASELNAPTVKCQEIVFNLVTVTFPLSIENGDFVAAIYLTSFGLDGYLPPEFFNISSILYMNINYNHLLRGTIPNQISNPVNLTMLGLNNNNFEGTLPQVNKLKRLRLFYANNNDLTGTLPALTGMTSLAEINLNYNSIEGTIPSLEGLDALVNVNLYFNLIEGTIPSLQSAPRLEFFNINMNMVEGTIPPLSGLIGLTAMEVYVNFLTGTIPSLEGLDNLQHLYLDWNYLEGSIPAVQQLLRLKYISANRNHLSGSIPTLAGLMSLQYVYLQFNLLSGAMPNINSLTSLQYFIVNNNQLSGHIQEFQVLPALNYLYLNDNQLQGSAPTSLQNLNNLTLLNLQDNFLTGQLPIELCNLTRLSSLLLHGNSFSGAPSRSLPSSITDLDISDNNFSGTVPVEVFLFAKVQHVAMIKNCFSGTLSDAICRASSSLLSLGLDGLTSGTNCQKPLLWGLTHTFSVPRFIVGTIPSCLFDMTLLHSLELSGNGLTGTLPSGTSACSSTIRNLSLSHNRLSGTIPDIFQSHVYDWLDLSYNKFSGSLGGFQEFFVLDKSNINANDTRQLLESTNRTIAPAKKILTLEVNRFSGNLPGSFQEAQHISVVTGNLFDCPSQAYLPVNDPGTPQTQCGSYDLNVGLGFWLTAAALTGCVVVLCLICQRVNWCSKLLGNIDLCVRSCNSNLAECNSGLATQFSSSVAKDTVLISFASFGHFLNHLFVCFIALSVAALTLFLSSELVLKFVQNHDYATHEIQYAYTPSIAFLTGAAPAAILLTLFVVTMAAVWGAALASKAATPDHTLIQHQTTSSHVATAIPVSIESEVDEDDDDGVVAAATKGAWNLFELFLWSLVLLIDAVVLLSVNTFYLIVALNYRQLYANLAVVALVAFKLTWNARVIPFAVHQVEARVRKSTLSSAMMMAWLMLFNNVLVPLLITLCTQPDCYYYMFVPPSSISAIVVFNVPDPFNHYTIYFPDFETLTFSPSFTYSYQCSSSLITYYLPMYVIMYTYLSFVSPLVCAVVLVLQERKSNYCASLPPDQPLSHTVTFAHNMLALIGCDIMQSRRDLLSSCNTPLVIAQYSCLFNGRDVAATLVCHLATLLTFGLAYPLLSVLIGCAAVVEILRWKILMGRYLAICNEADNSKTVKIEGNVSGTSQAMMWVRLERSCDGVEHMLYQSRWLLLIGMTLFFSLFMLDMTGDRARDNWRDMLWAPLVLLLWPCGLALVELLAAQWGCSISFHGKLVAVLKSCCTCCCRGTDNNAAKSSLAVPLIS